MYETNRQTDGRTERDREQCVMRPGGGRPRIITQRNRACQHINKTVDHVDAVS